MLQFAKGAWMNQLRLSDIVTFGIELLLTLPTLPHAAHVTGRDACWSEAHVVITEYGVHVTYYLRKLGPSG